MLNMIKYMTDSPRHQPILKLLHLHEHLLLNFAARLPHLLLLQISLRHLHIFLNLKILQIRLTTKYGVCLARARLPIRHHHTIEALYHVLDNGTRYFIIRLRLLHSRRQDPIKVEVAVLILGADQTYALVRGLQGFEERVSNG